MTAPLIYNLFPRHFKTIDEWPSMVPHVRDMGFTCIFVNPFHATGFSGSLYAIQDYYKLNPYMLKKGADPRDWTPLRKFIKACDEAGLRVVMDLVVNHTAKDSPMVDEHPKWYCWNQDGTIKSPSAVNVGEGTITVWGDLASVDNANSSERKALWKFWDHLIGFFQSIGITAFRCDAAYQVPAALWKDLITKARKRDPQAAFFAETLGCSIDQTEALSSAGFDYLFNSSKYWNFDQSWCIDQHEQFQHIAPSISFPESHDTPRLAGEQPGHVNWQKNRYFLAAAFSKGLMMTMGYEYGAVTKMDVVKGTPADVDKPRWDLSQWIAAVNAYKLSQPLLCQDGHWRALSTYEWDLLFLEKRSDDRASACVLLINKDWHNKRIVRRSEFPGDLHDYRGIVRIFGEEFGREALPEEFEMEKCEIVMIVR